MTISGCSSTSTVIPPRTPCASTVTGSAHAAQREPARKPLDAGRADRGRERDEADDEADAAVPELDERVEVLLREERRAAARPVVTAEPRAGEAHRRARDHDQEERGERDVGKQGEGLRGDGEARPGDLRRVGFHQARARPVPSTTLPDAARGRAPASANAASSTAPFSAGSETRRPPAVCGSKPSVPSSSGTPSSSSRAGEELAVAQVAAGAKARAARRPAPRGEREARRRRGRRARRFARPSRARGRRGRSPSRR